MIRALLWALVFGLLTVCAFTQSRDQTAPESELDEYCCNVKMDYDKRCAAHNKKI